CAWCAAGPAANRLPPSHSRLSMLRGADPLADRGEAKIGECRSACRDIERAVSVVRHGAVAGTRFDGDLVGRSRNNAFGDVAERMRFTGCDVERPGAAPSKHAKNQLSDVVDENMITAFLAFAEQNNVLTLTGESSKPVRTIAIVRIIGAVKQR